MKGDWSSHKGLQAQHITPGLSCKRLAVCKFIYLLFFDFYYFWIVSNLQFVLPIYPNLLRCSRCSWKRNLEKILLLYSISWWHSFCCQFKWKTSIWWDAARRSFPEFPDTLFFPLHMYLHILIYTYIYTFQITFPINIIFFS